LVSHGASHAGDRGSNPYSPQAETGAGLFLA
jgi:hypothetical protein